MSLDYFDNTPILSERDLVAAGPDYGSEACICGPYATPARECPVHWAIWLCESKMREAAQIPEFKPELCPRNGRPIGDCREPHLCPLCVGRSLGGGS